MPAPNAYGTYRVTTSEIIKEGMKMFLLSYSHQEYSAAKNSVHFDLRRNEIESGGATGLEGKKIVVHLKPEN